METPAPPDFVDNPLLELFYKAMAATSGVVVILGLAWSVVALVEVWVIVSGALLVGASLAPAVEWLEKMHMPRAIAVSVTFLAVTAGAVIALMSLIPTIMGQGQDLATSLPLYVDNLQALMTTLHARHPAIPEGSKMIGFMAEQGSQVLSNAFSLTGRFVWIMVVVLSILFLALFMLLDGRSLQANLLRLIPIRQRSQLPALLQTVERRIGRYMLGLGIICLLAGLVTWWSMAILGVPYALLIGAVTALLQAIPLVGPLVGGGLAALLGLSISAKLAVYAMVAYTVIQQVIGQFLFPLLMGRTIGMHPVWIAVALLVGGTLYGLTGAFLAIPMAIAISIVIECYYLPWAESKAAEMDSK